MTAGVKIPTDQFRTGNQGPPNTVTAAYPIEMIAVSYFDEVGREIREIWYKMGDRLYKAPNQDESEKFVRELRPIKPAFAEQVLKRLSWSRSPVPSPAVEDVVDVLGGAPVGQEPGSV